MVKTNHQPKICSQLRKVSRNFLLIWTSETTSNGYDANYNASNKRVKYNYTLLPFSCCLTCLFNSRDYSRLGWDPKKPPEEELYGLLKKDFSFSMLFLSPNQQYQSTEKVINMNFPLATLHIRTI